jgi:tRNA-specific 2-thiouridylase
MQVKAISLLSGGLDSTLATLLVVRQGVPVVAVKFVTAFGCDAGEGSSCGFDASSLASRFGFELKLCPMGEEYVEMVKAPAHGWGKNMNPCVDCRIMMLRWGRELMQETGAGFLVTGEVLDQRPMSQNRPMLGEVERETGLEGLLLRPLSAKLLPPTIPEQRGWVDRERLLDISGRSRKRQLELAREFGLTTEEFGQPAGGCLLTDPGFSTRLRDLWDHDPAAGITDIQLLKLGRHFRIDGTNKVVVGRNESENDAIEALRRTGDVLLKPKDVPGPSVILRGHPDAARVLLAAALTRRYSDGKAGGAVLVTEGGAEREMQVSHEEVARVLERVSHIV